MKGDGHTSGDVETLVREIGMYLATIDELRAAGREPTWRRGVGEAQGRIPHSEIEAISSGGGPALRRARLGPSAPFDRVTDRTDPGARWVPPPRFTV
jgi:hypothetical protein